MSFWYCSLSRGRAIALPEARKIFGVDQTREIWVRSEVASSRSEWKCPSCTKPMKVVSEPRWMSGGEIDVCRSCRLLWVKADTHEQIPHPEDLISEEGDSTLLQDRADGSTELLLLREKIKEEKSAWVTAPPPEVHKRVLGFLGIPVEENSYRTGFLEAWITSLVMLLCLMIHWGWGSSELYKAFAFYPADPLKNFGFNIFSAGFLHGGWFHLLFNLYFFNMFADDLEEDLGKIKFVGLLVFASLVTAAFQMYLGTSPDVPHIGLSGVVMATMCYYTLAFPDNRIAYLIPGIHIWNHGKGEAWVRSLRWLRLPVWIVFGFYAIKDILNYYFFEREGFGNISHSGHIGGIVAGLVFFWIFSKPRIKEKNQEESILLATDKVKIR